MFKISQFALLYGVSAYDESTKTCVNQCHNEMKEEDLKTVDQDFMWYRECLSKNCGVKIPNNYKSDHKTCAFLCQANAFQQGFTDALDHDNYIGECYTQRCGILYNPHQRSPKEADIILPKYVGCYNNGSEGELDFQHNLGVGASVRACLDLAKHGGYDYAGLGQGNQCWGGNEYGRYGRVADHMCNWVCTADKGYTCGAEKLNSVWDIRRYNGRKVKDQPLCKDERIYAPPDCSRKGGYNPRDLCMNTCNSETLISEREACGIKCIDYKTADIKDLEVAHKLCVNKCVNDKQNEPNPLGCFRDAWDRDLTNKLGKNLTPEQCFKEGKKQGMTYVGLQNGDECWGDISLGSLGKAPATECQVPCSRDHSKFCGGGFRNLIYDIKYLNRGNAIWKARQKEECEKYGHGQFVDCTNKGGYDPHDECNQTCISKEEILNSDACPLHCAAQILYLNFRSKKDKQKYIDNCKASCLGVSGLATYKGCFAERPAMFKEFKTQIGRDLTVQECFNLAKESKLRYVALTAGNQCHGNDSYGKYGPLLDSVYCNLDCQADEEVKCGGTFSNSVYDLKDYKPEKNCDDLKPVDCSNRGGYDKTKDPCNQTCVNDVKASKCLSSCKLRKFFTRNVHSRSPLSGSSDDQDFNECMDKCETYRTISCGEEFVDCSGLGGYNPKDQCRKTCMIKDNTTDKESCGIICQNDTKNLKFKDKEDSYTYYQECEDSCMKTVSQKDAQCPKNFVNCDSLGGYDPKDDCKQTCVLQETQKEVWHCQQSCQQRMINRVFINDEVEYNWWNKCNSQCNQLIHSCSNKCNTRVSEMRFLSTNEKLQYYYSCKIKCEIETVKAENTQEKSCPGTFVDCSEFGGYDPTDPCKQTCNQRRDGNRTQDEKDYSNDTTQTDIEKDFRDYGKVEQIIKNGKKVKVDCQKYGKGVKCFDKESKEQIQFKKGSGMKGTYLHQKRAPNGAYWKFDCTWIQKMVYENCWEGDDDKGKSCTFWDRALNLKECNDCSRLVSGVGSVMILAYLITQ